MSIFDARRADEFFDMGSRETYAFSSKVSTTPTLYSWKSVGRDLFTATGTGFATAPDGRASRGTVIKLTVDLSSDANLDLVVTGTRAPLAPMTSQRVNDGNLGTFWERMLSGDDRILAPLTVAAAITGDFETVGFYSRTRVVTGGDDAITGGTGAGQTLVGDALHVGGDEFRGSLTGGNDTIVAQNTRGTSIIVGDARDVDGNALINGSGSCRGGADILTGSDTRGDTIVGDARGVGDASCTGGADRLFGRGGNDTLIGDVDTVWGDNYSRAIISEAVQATMSLSAISGLCNPTPRIVGRMAAGGLTTDCLATRVPTASTEIPEAR